jgi:hypothetical protein
MANLKHLIDVYHWWGSDLTVSSTGDLATVIRTDRSRQRVLRRLMTAPGDYLSHPDYGAGLPAYVGQIAETEKIKAVISGQMKLEASVDQSASNAPAVTVSAFSNGLQVSISYKTASEQDPAVVSFSASE